MTQAGPSGLTAVVWRTFGATSPFAREWAKVCVPPFCADRQRDRGGLLRGNLSGSRGQG